MTTYYVSGTRITDGAPIYTLAADSLFVFQGGELIADGADEAVVLGSTNYVQVDGAIYSGGPVCLAVTGSGNEIMVGRTGVLSSAGFYAIDGAGATTSLTNYGQIYSDGVAVALGTSARVVNGGVISAGGGVYIDGGRVVNTGEITGATYAVSGAGLGSALFINSGRLVADTAIYGHGSVTTTVRNSGVIDGLIFCEDGADKVDTRHGVLNGDTYLGGGMDTFLGGDSHELVEAGAGADLVKGGGGDDDLRGGFDNDQLRGMTGDDALSGDDGVDQLGGGAGDDLIEGGAGNDVIVGDSGDDTLSGGKNSDTFVFRAGYGQDTVTDFKDNGNDLIRFARNVFDDYADMMSHTHAAGGDVVIEAEDGSTLVLAATALGALGAGDFVFG
jgi:Ca2+-binding RTX toxin-like protein